MKRDFVSLLTSNCLSILYLLLIIILYLNIGVSMLVEDYVESISCSGSIFIPYSFCDCCSNEAINELVSLGVVLITLGNHGVFLHKGPEFDTYLKKVLEAEFYSVYTSLPSPVLVSDLKMKFSRSHDTFYEVLSSLCSERKVTLHYLSTSPFSEFLLWEDT